MSKQTIKFRLITIYQDGLVDITEYNKIVNTGNTSFNQWRLNVGKEIEKAIILIILMAAPEEQPSSVNPAGADTAILPPHSILSGS